MTYEEKKQLKLDVNKLPRDKLGELVKLISTKEDCPRSAAGDHVEVDFSTLRTSTLRALQRFVAACLQKSSSSSSKKASSDRSDSLSSRFRAQA